MIAHKKTENGFSLIELMIALLISTIVAAAVIQLFLSSRQVYRVQDAKAHIQENGRLAMQVLTDSILNVGYRGCRTFNITDADINNTLNNPDAFGWAYATPIEGFEASSSSWSPSTDSSLSLARSGTDIITLRLANDPIIKVTKHPGGTPPGSANLQVTTGNQLKAGDIVMVHDCESAAVFQISSGNPDTSGSIPHNTGGNFTPGNATQALGKNYEGAWLTRLSTRSFYVSQDSNGRSSLVQHDSLSGSAAIASDIENMQIQYAIDINDDKLIDNMVAADAVTDWGQVIAVNVEIVAVSASDNLTVDGPQPYLLAGNLLRPDDRRLRQVFSKTITLRNRVR